MTSPVPVNGYATVDDYELRTGTTVPDERVDTVQQQLNDTSSLIDVYLGDNQEVVAEAYPDVLTMLTVNHVYQVASVPSGVRSESVGGTSVSYADTGTFIGLSPSEMTLLDDLMDRVVGSASGGVGQIGVTLGGEPDDDDDWPADVDIWLLAAGQRKGLPR